MRNDKLDMENAFITIFRAGDTFGARRLEGALNCRMKAASSRRTPKTPERGFAAKVPRSRNLGNRRSSPHSGV
jgi:hypothetical protein